MSIDDLLQPSSFAVQILFAGFILVFGWYFVYPRYEIIKAETDAFVESYRETSIAWLSSIAASLVAVTIGSKPGTIVDISVLLLFFGPAIMHIMRYYPFTLWAKYVSIDPNSGQRSASESETNTCRIEPSGSYCLTLEMEVGEQIDRYLLEVNTPPEVEVSHVQSGSTVHRVTAGGRVTGWVPEGRSSYDIHIYIEPLDDLAEEGKNTVTIRHHATDRKLETVELLPQA